MPVRSIILDPAPGALVQACTACRAERAVALDALVLGAGGAAAVDPNLIALPACPCGAREFLVRTFDACPAALAGTPFAAQRRAVNALAEHLKAAGRSHPDAAARHAAEASPPADIATLPLADVPLPAGPVADGGAEGGR